MGIYLKICNANYKRDKILLFFEGLPQLILLSSVFGYLSLLIIYKWIIVHIYYKSRTGTMKCR